MTEITFPPLRDLPPGHLEARKQHLLREIAPGTRRISRRGVLVAAVGATALVGAGATVAAGLGAFNGIGAANHSRSTSDVMDPTTAAYVQEHLAGIQPDTARHIGRLPSGQEVYVITGTQGDLCVVVGPPPSPTATCGDPLSDAHPATLETYPISNNEGTKVIRWIVFGVALDGVTSVSFQPTQATDTSGQTITVPVSDNLWTWQTDEKWPPDVLQSVTAHFADGTTVVEPPTGTNCAAC